MWLRIKDIKLLAEKLNIAKDNIPEEYEKTLLTNKVCKVLHIPSERVRKIEIYRKSPDLRKKSEPYFIYTVDTEISGEIKQNKDFSVITKKQDLYNEYIESFSKRAKGAQKRPVIVGFGPAGIFCALVMTELGFKPIVIERGENVEERTKSVEYFWQKGQLNTESNIQFGEGGAGTFSDGKLNSLIRDKDTVGRFVLGTFVKFGAPKEIL